LTWYLLRRMAGAMLVVLLVSFAVYGLIGLMPGDPIDLMVSADPNLTPADAARLKALYGLDQPIWERYVAWLGNALQGDFGYSRLHANPVWEVIEPRLGNTAILMGLSFVLSLAIALPLGVFAALKPRSVMDSGINLLAFAGVSLPPFFLAILLIILFAVDLGWLPAGGTTTPGVDSLADRARYAVLPVLALTLATVGHYVRFVRASMIETLRLDYVRTARAKGVGRFGVVVRHALRNALIPVVTIVALRFGSLFSGALITETVFAYLGMGKLIYDSIMGNDYSVAMVTLVTATGVVLLANLLADLLYAWLDPRISYG